MNVQPKGRVWVTQKPSTHRHHDGAVKRQLDLGPARAFGELVYLASRGDAEEGTEGSLLWQMREQLKTFNSRADYLLPMGHIITMVTAAIAAAEMGDGTVRMLQWDRRLKSYEVYTLDIHAQPEAGTRPA